MLAPYAGALENIRLQFLDENAIALFYLFRFIKNIFCQDQFSKTSSEPKTDLAPEILKFHSKKI